MTRALVWSLAGSMVLTAGIAWSAPTFRFEKTSEASITLLGHHVTARLAIEEATQTVPAGDLILTGAKGSRLSCVALP